MAWDKGFNFRDSSGYVTDDATETYVLADAYPTTRNGVTFGWTSGTVATADRDNGNDRRLAGINYEGGAGQAVFRIDLPNTGTFNISIAAGDAGFEQSGDQQVQILDNSTLKATVADHCPANSFLDALDTVYTAANWPANNDPLEVEFASTICNIRIGNGTEYTTIAHVFVSEVEGGGGGTVPIFVNNLRRQGIS